MSSQPSDDNSTPRRRMIFRPRNIAAACSVFIVLCIVGSLWSTFAKYRLQRDVEAIGGKWEEESLENPLELWFDKLSYVIRNQQMPPEIPSLLVRIDFSKSEVSDLWIAEHLSGMKRVNIEALSFENTEITDATIVSLSEVTSNGQLILSETNITDGSIPWLVSMQDLFYIDLCKTKVTDEGLCELLSHPFLDRLAFEGRLLTDRAVSKLNEAAQDSWIKICNIESEQMIQIAKLDQMTQLELIGLPDEAIHVLCELKQLETLYIKDSTLSDEAIKDLKACLPETKVRVWRGDQIVELE